MVNVICTAVIVTVTVVNIIRVQVMPVLLMKIARVGGNGKVIPVRQERTLQDPVKL